MLTAIRAGHGMPLPPSNPDTMEVRGRVLTAIRAQTTALCGGFNLPNGHLKTQDCPQYVVARNYIPRRAPPVHRPCLLERRPRTSVSSFAYPAAPAAAAPGCSLPAHEYNAQVKVKGLGVVLCFCACHFFC